jgi:hypothetical protein
MFWLFTKAILKQNNYENIKVTYVTHQFSMVVNALPYWIGTIILLLFLLWFSLMKALVESWNMRLVIVNKKESIYLIEKNTLVSWQTSIRSMKVTRKKFAEHNPCKSEVSSRFKIPSESTLVVEHSGNVQKYLSDTHHPPPPPKTS